MLPGKLCKQECKNKHIITPTPGLGNKNSVARLPVATSTWHPTKSWPDPSANTAQEQLMYTAQQPVQCYQLFQNTTKDDICSKHVLENITWHPAPGTFLKNPPEDKEMTISMEKGRVGDTGPPLDYIPITKQGNAQEYSSAPVVVASNPNSHIYINHSNNHTHPPIPQPPNHIGHFHNPTTCTDTLHNTPTCTDHSHNPTTYTDTLYNPPTCTDNYHNPPTLYTHKDHIENYNLNNPTVPKSCLSEKLFNVSKECCPTIKTTAQQLLSKKNLEAPSLHINEDDKIISEKIEPNPPKPHTHKRHNHQKPNQNCLYSCSEGDVKAISRQSVSLPYNCSVQLYDTLSSLYSELMSWRRTNYVKKAVRLFLYLLVFFFIRMNPPVLGVLGSESPDRECCENPMYTFDLPGGAVFTTFAPPYDIRHMTYEPPEQPDLPEVPQVPGTYIPKPGTSSLGCLEAKQLCIEDKTCSQILQVIPMVCGLEQVVCSTITVSKCQAALRTLRSFPYFNPTCLCKPPTPDDHFCNDFSELLFDHPCLNTLPKVSDPYPVDALPYCTHAQDVCNNEPSCKRKVVSFQKRCRTVDDACVMDDVESCHGSWQEMRQSPIFGCICPNGMPNYKRCQQIFQTVNGNPCIDAQIPDGLRPVYSDLKEAEAFWINYYRGIPGYQFEYPAVSSARPPMERTTRDTPRPPKGVTPKGGPDSSTPWHIPTNWKSNNGARAPSQKDERVINMKSTCHIAADNCERDAACRPYLDALKSKCVDTCSRDRCMGSVQEFYRRIPRKHAMDIAFCLCKQQNDDQCFRAQSLLHPVCAQTPVNWSGREQDLPACHELAKSCSSSPDCRGKLSRYEQACAVDAKTKTCAGPYEGCRNAMLDILGTELRMNCNCNGSGGVVGDFRRLYDCIGYQRLFWLNPCIVDAQKDYHLMIGNTEGPVDWTSRPGGYTTPYLPPQTPYRQPRPPVVTKPPPTPYRPPPRRTTPPVKRPPETGPRTPPRPFAPTIPPTWPQPPTTPSRRPTRPMRTTRRYVGKATETPEITTPSVIALPPKYCKVEDLDGGEVKFIREGFEKRFYAKNKEGSNLCSCKEDNGKSQHYCTYLQEIEKKPCNTGKAFYSHNSPFYLPSRGACLCYSGQFICAKPDSNKGRKGKEPEGENVAPPTPPGVFLYLGFSRIDSEVLKKGRMKLNDEVPLTDEEEENETKNTIQQTVSHFTSNANKSDCRISLESRQGENYILKATLDEFDEYRMKKNMSDFMKWKEKEECFAALDSISTKVNAKDRDMMSHIILSMFKVAAAEANVPEYEPSSATTLNQQIVMTILTVQIYFMHRQPLL